MKKKIFVLVSVLLVIIGVYWIWTHSYLEVKVEAANNQDTKIQIVDQSDGKATDTTTRNGSIKKLVRRGHYEILVKQNGSSYFKIVRANGWLGTVSTQAALAPEKQRQFIGDNPGPCASYSRQVLVTFGCNDTFRNLTTHVPATAKQPTYALKPAKTSEGIIEGIVQTSEGTVAVLKRPPGADSDTMSPHTAYLLSDKSELTGGIALKGLDDKATYTVIAYKQGMLLYNEAAGRLLYFSARGTLPSEIQITATDKMHPYAVSVNDDEIVVTSSETDKKVNPDNPAGAKLKSEATIINGQQLRHIALSKQYSSITTCGTGKLCALLNKKLEVYDISSGKAKLLYEVQGVDRQFVISGQLLLVRGGEILTFDVEKRSGSIDFSVGEYTGCGLLPVAPQGRGGYTLCLVNSKAKKVAVLLDPSQPNTDDIDKKVAELTKSTEIKSLSVYGTYIHLTPNAGELVYDKKSHEFTYDSSRVQSANTAINQAIDRVRIDRTKYQIVNPFATR